ISLSPSAIASAGYDQSLNQKNIDFYLVYSMPKLKPTLSRRQTGTVGIGSHYQMFFPDKVGFFVNPNALFLPARHESEKITVVIMGIEGGPSFRLAPYNYFDPVLSFGGGVVGADAGKQVKADTMFPVMGRFGLNL